LDFAELHARFRESSFSVVMVPCTVIWTMLDGDETHDVLLEVIVDKLCNEQSSMDSRSLLAID